MDDQPTSAVSTEKVTSDDGNRTNSLPEISSIWGDAQIQTATIAQDISATKAGNSLALLFNDAGIEFTSEASPMTAAVIATLQVPIAPNEDKQFLGYAFSLRGGIVKDKGARATVQVDILGLTHTLVFPYDQARGAAADDANIDVQLFSLERRGAKDMYADGQRPPLPPCVITLVITAQRLTPQDTVLVRIDSLDIEAIELPR